MRTDPHPNVSPPVIAEMRQANICRALAESRLRIKFYTYMQADLSAHTGKGTAGEVLEDALGYRDFMQRALAQWVKTPEAQPLLAEVARHYAWRMVE